ncbi:hypothetical protein [Delftia tsuruhatensis]|uniref:hypothetical protein n=1 Tax=Delftia tsuruhatensis TaxID=180282 RepID=UPI0031D34947
MTVVIPLRVDLLAAKVERLTELSSNAGSISNELVRTKQELAEARAALQANLKKSSFQGESVYPIGFDDVVIGTPKADVIARYPEGKWDEDNLRYSVRSRFEGIINTATYFYSEDKVSTILFHIDWQDQIGAEIVRKHLLATFGVPDAIRKRDMFWKATKREWISFSPDYGGAYRVYASNSPGLINYFGLANIKGK